MVSILEVKKDSRVQLKNGWFATILDNKVNAHTRMAEVEGYATERGSVYSTDIRYLRTEYDRDNDHEKWEAVVPTPGHIKAGEMRKVFGF